MPDKSGNDDDFRFLASLRKRLQIFCEPNVQSVFAFQFNDGLSFKRDTAEPDDPLQTGVRHLTSSATCVESLLACPEYFYPKDSAAADTEARIKKLATAFAEGALSRQEWKSDGSGDIYCRCRTLPLVIEQVGDPTDQQKEIIKEHIKYVFEQVSSALGHGKPGQSESAGTTRFGIGERDNSKPDDSYPANAYHSYWSLAALTTAEQKEIDTGVARQSSEAVLLWAKMKLGTEVALHSADSALLDSDQLAWATIIFIAFQNSVKVNLAEQDLVRQAFKCLFSTQTDSGIWRHYQPLFHYKKSGNAYCYNFETIATLLKVVLARNEVGAFYLNALRPYLKNLTRLFEYAERSRRPIQGINGAAWDSGHRSNNSEPESWATASVYLFAQGLRRCVGIWTRNEVDPIGWTKKRSSLDGVAAG